MRIYDKDWYQKLKMKLAKLIGTETLAEIRKLGLEHAKAQAEEARAGHA